MAAPRKLEVEHQWNANQWDWPVQHNDGVVKVVNDAHRFEVGMEVQYFLPKEIDVRAVGNDLFISCSHDERSDHHGTITRQISRVYKLPSDVDTSSLRTALMPNGILKIYANKIQQKA